MDRVVAVVTEVPLDDLPTGPQRRALSTLAWLGDNGVPAVPLSAHSASASGLGFRAYSTLTATARIRGDLRSAGATTAFVVGLGAPHLLLVAAALSRTHHVIYDACDSWHLQVAARRGSSASTLPSRAGLLLQRVAARKIRLITYISSRDAEADARLVGPGQQRVLGIRADPALAGIQPMTGPVQRLVVPADLKSFHNSAFTRAWLSVAAQAAQKYTKRPLEIYGPNAGDMVLPSTARHMGWAPSLAHIYDGNTAVLITNVAGSGVPNKFVEAQAARRPIIAHESLDYVDRTGNSPVHWFADIDQLDEAVRAAVNGEEGDRSERAGAGGAACPSLSLSDFPV